MKRAAPTSRTNFFVCDGCAAQRRILEYGEVGVQSRIQPMNSIEYAACDLDRGELARAKLGREIMDG
jgi:hypothetical protein